MSKNSNTPKNSLMPNKFRGSYTRESPRKSKISSKKSKKSQPPPFMLKK